MRPVMIRHRVPIAFLHCQNEPGQLLVAHLKQLYEAQIDEHLNRKSGSVYSGTVSSIVVERSEFSGIGHSVGTSLVSHRQAQLLDILVSYLRIISSGYLEWV